MHTSRCTWNASLTLVSCYATFTAPALALVIKFLTLIRSQCIMSVLAENPAVLSKVSQRVRFGSAGQMHTNDSALAFTPVVFQPK